MDQDAGTARTFIEFAPLVPWPLIAAAAVLAGATLLTGLMRRARGLGWRFVAFAMLLLALSEPSIVREEREPIEDVAVIVTDASPSQDIGERQARTRRAADALESDIARLGMQVRRIEARAGGAAGSVDETRLFATLEEAIADTPRRRLAGVVMVTDGQVHDVPHDIAGRLEDHGPFHTLLSGTRSERDRRIEIVQAPAWGLVGKPLSMTIRIEDEGADAGDLAIVKLAKDGAAPVTQAVRTGQDAEIDFTIDHGGATVIELSVDPVAGELTQANNRVAVVVNGVRDRLRVLLVSGVPHAGERTWRNLLKADPSVDLIHFTILRPPEKQDGTPIRELSLIAFPIRELFEIKLDEFDLVIFDRYRRRGVLPPVYFANIAEYVRNGGALLEASGPAFAQPTSMYRTALAGVLPGEPTGRVREAPFRPQITGTGYRHPVTAGLPGDTPGSIPRWGRWYRHIDIAPNAGNVVMNGLDGRPLLVLDRIGEGRVAQLASDHIWLWSRGHEGGGPQAELLRRLAHWLMKEPELEENDLRTRVDGTRITVVRRSLEPDPRSVAWTAPDGKTGVIELEPGPGGRSTGVLDAGQPGVWRFDDGSKTAFAVVGAVNPPELMDVRTTEELMRPVADATGGSIIWLEDTPEPSVRALDPGRTMAGREWLGLRRNGDHIVTGVRQIPLLPVALMLVLALAPLAAAWRREGR